MAAANVTPRAYELLAVLLCGWPGPGTGGAGAGRRRGGAELSATYGPEYEPLDALESEMASRGFEPRRDVRGPLIELVLERCPFQAAASADPEIVCEIHRGLAQGILEGMQLHLRVRSLIAHEPERAGCRLQLEPKPPATPPG